MSELTITRVVDAPRELVFRAWIDPDQLARWYGPTGVHTPRETIEFDVRPGGRWRLTMINDETGDAYPSRGASIMNTPTLDLPAVVSREEWLAARKELLVKEKAATRARDELNAQRRMLPMVRVEKEYVFDTSSGKRSLAELFDGRRQLIVYHAMWHPEHGHLCDGCSLLIDAIPHLSHLHARNTTLTVVSRGPLADLRGYWKRMGWTVPVVSAQDTDFNDDFQATIDPARGLNTYNFVVQDGSWSGEVPGTSVFLADGDEVFHTYSSYARGGDQLLTMYTYLDLTPLGRQEDWEQPPGRSDGPFMSWVRRHDEY